MHAQFHENYGFSWIVDDIDPNYTMGDMALQRLEIDELGLDETDRRILLALIDKFGGGPAGLDTIAATTGEDAGTIEDVYEPYLLQLGFIARTPRGRICLKAAYEHLGKRPSEKQKSQLSLFDDSGDENY